MTLKERKEELDKLLAKLIKDSERPHKRPIDSKILNPFYHV